MPKSNVIITEQGPVHYWDNCLEKPAIVFLHMNSAAKSSFLKQFYCAKDVANFIEKKMLLPNKFTSALSKKYRLIALDLLGHGENPIPINQKQAYCYDGYARTVATVLRKLPQPLITPIVVGTSLGGHVAIELINKQQDFYRAEIQGLILSGTPPISLANLETNQEAFVQLPQLLRLKQQSRFLLKDMRKFVAFAGIRGLDNDFFVRMVMSMDPIARPSLQRWKLTPDARVIDQLQTVAQCQIPIAIISGKYDIAINNNYLVKRVDVSKLWGNKFHVLPCAHATFWLCADEFNQLVADFGEMVISKIR